ncbi:MAG TPA: hypothetical protein VF118_03505 [Gemmatimonadaceae bacterium]
MRVSIGPSKANAPLIIHANTVLAASITFEFLQPIARWHAKVLQRFSRIHGHQLPKH